MQAPTRQFNNAVHALRAFATMMVFSAHLCDSFSTYFFPASSALNVAMPFAKRFGTFGVELFFIISGYVIMNSVGRYNLREFFLRRLIRIYPVFAFFTILFFALNQIERHYPDRLSVGPLLANLGFLDIYCGTPALSPNAWSLTFEANFYVFAGIGCFLLVRRLVAPAVALALLALAFLTVFPIAAYFVVGCLLYAARGLQTNSVPRGVQLAVFAVWCVLAASIDHESSSLWNIVLLAASAIFFFVVTAPDGLFARFAAVKWIFFFGTISYSFYLTHPYAYLPMRFMFQRLSLDDLNIGVAAALYFPAVTVAAIIASYAIYRLLEVAPYSAAFGESVFDKSRLRGRHRAPVHPEPAEPQQIMTK